MLLIFFTYCSEALLVLLGAARELLVGDEVVQTLHVRLEALGRLGGHLDAGLQDGDGELGVRARAEPQSELGVRLFDLQALDQLVQLRHPAQRQVTVGQEHPVALTTRRVSLHNASVSQLID